MKTIYTVITDDYDNLKPIRVKNPDWRYVAFLNSDQDANGWEVISIKELEPPEVPNNHYLQRWAKLVGGLKFLKCETIYIDGSHELLGDITELWNNSLMFKKHPRRNDYVEEGEACKKQNKANCELIDRQVSSYVQSGVPRYSGMFETSIIFRPYSEQVCNFCDRWWKELLCYTHRDQLSIMKVIHDTQIPHFVLDDSVCSQYVQKHHHNKKIL